MTCVVRKDASIWEVVAKMAAIFGDQISVVDDSEADLFAVGVNGLNSEDRLIYISTYNKAPGRYDCDCDAGDVLAGGTSEAHQDVGFAELVELFKAHLSLERSEKPSDE